LKILGFDPGLAILGYGIVYKEGQSIKPIDWGVILTKAGISLPERLEKLYVEITDLIRAHKPDAVAIEELFFNKNVKTAISISHARGVIMLAPSIARIPIYEYTPLEVKQAVTGYGRAQKNQIQQMTKLLLNLREIPKPDDAADALAVAICHAQSSTMQNIIEMKTKEF